MVVTDIGCSNSTGRPEGSPHRHSGCVRRFFHRESAASGLHDGSHLDRSHLDRSLPSPTQLPHPSRWPHRSERSGWGSRRPRRLPPGPRHLLFQPVRVAVAPLAPAGFARPNRRLWCGPLLPVTRSALASRTDWPTRPWKAAAHRRGPHPRTYRLARVCSPRPTTLQSFLSVLPDDAALRVHPDALCSSAFSSSVKCSESTGRTSLASGLAVLMSAGSSVSTCVHPRGSCPSRSESLDTTKGRVKAGGSLYWARQLVARSGRIHGR